MFGGMAIFVSMDVKRYGSVIVYLAYATMAFGVLLTGIDAMAGPPTYWTPFEEPPTLIIGAVILLLVRRANREANDISIPESL